MTQLYDDNEGHDDRISNALELARELYEAPACTSARFVPSGPTPSDDDYYQVELSLSQKSLENVDQHSSTKLVTVSSTDDSVVSRTSLVPNRDDVKHSTLSRDHSLRALFRVVKKDGTTVKRTIEVYSTFGDRKLDEVDVTDDAGDFYFDSTFGPPAWIDNRFIVFVAEAPSSSCPNKERDAEKFRYTPDYGETFTGKKEPTLFLVELTRRRRTRTSASANKKKKNKVVHRLTFPDTVESVNFGQPEFVTCHDDDDDRITILATGYHQLRDARKLGIVYCSNRPSRIYELVITASSSRDDDDGSFEFKVERATPISPERLSARSPRVYSSSSSRIVSAVYLTNRLGGVHSSCASLHLATLDLSSSSSSSAWKSRELVETVSEPGSIEAFPGLYVDQLPRNPFVTPVEAGSTYVVMSSIWRSRRVPLVVDLVDGTVTNLAPLRRRRHHRSNSNDDLPYLGVAPDELDSYNVLATDSKGRIVAARSGITRVPRVVVCNLEKSPPRRVVDVDGAIVDIEVDWKVVHMTNVSNERKHLSLSLTHTVGFSELKKRLSLPFFLFVAFPIVESTLSKMSSTILPLPGYLGSEIIHVSPPDDSGSARTGSHNNNDDDYSNSGNSTTTRKRVVPPLSLTGHGGPNSTTCTDFNVATCAMSICGFQLAFTNYPGSLGFGQTFVDSLAPQLGRLEVACVYETKLVLERLGLSERGPDKNVYTGGSHGGWIGCHLATKYPDAFGACVLRNPVVDLPSMLASTDIPDWCVQERNKFLSFLLFRAHTLGEILLLICFHFRTYCEMNLDYSLDRPPAVLTPEVFKKLHEASPMTQSSVVTTPTLLLVGKKDRRVPPDQSRQWYHAIKPNFGRDRDGDGKKTKTPLEVEMLVFEREGHAITNEVEHEWCAFEQGLRFLAKHARF